MAAGATECGAAVRTGHTIKAIERGKGDKLLITTSGIGRVECRQSIGPQATRPGDRLVGSGDLGRHGLAVLAIRHGLELQPPVEEWLRPTLAGCRDPASGGPVRPPYLHPQGPHPRGAGGGGAGAGG